MIYVLSLVAFALLMLGIGGLVLLAFVGRKPRQSGVMAPPITYEPAPAVSYLPVSHREQVIQDKTIAIEQAYREAERAKFTADAIAEFKTLVV